LSGNVSFHFERNGSSLKCTKEEELKSSKAIPNETSPCSSTFEGQRESHHLLALIASIFGQQTLKNILQISLLAGNGPDILCWKPPSSGTCSPKNAYRSLMPEDMNSSPLFNIHMPVYSYYLTDMGRQDYYPNHVKYICTVLSWLQELLVRFMEYGVESSCSLCSNLEDDVYLFFQL
jgi:hypothetical protein